MTRHIEEKRPIDDTFRRERPEPGQVGKDWNARPAPAHLVVAFDLRMAIAVGGVGKLDRDEWFLRDVIKAEALAQDGGGHRAADQVREEIMEDDPLVVPAERKASIVEEVRIGNAVRPQLIDQAVVRMDKGN